MTWLLTSKSTEVLLGSCLIHVWSIIIVCQKEMELSNKNGGNIFLKSLKSKWPWFLTYWPQIERGPSQAMVNTSVKYHYCLAKINGYHMETIQSLKTKYDLVLWSFDPKINRGQYIWEVSLLYVKCKWSCGTETVKNLKSKFDLWPFEPKSTEVLLGSRSTYM